MLEIEESGILEAVRNGSTAGADANCSAVLIGGASETSIKESIKTKSRSKKNGASPLSVGVRY